MNSSRPSSLRPHFLALALGVGALPAIAQTTGFNQTGAGPFDYNTGANWVGGAINGIWDVSLTTTAAQTVTFGADTALSTGLSIGYTGNFDLSFRSDGVANRTVTLGGDLTINPVSNRTITFGSTTANQGLNVNLGGNRTFTVAGAKTLRFHNQISGGDLAILGTSSTASGGTVRLSGDNASASASNITVGLNSTLQFDSTTSGNLGATRAQNVSLISGGKLLASGNNTADSTEIVSGSVIIDGSYYRPTNSGNSIASITVTPGTRNTLLKINEVQRASKGVVLFRGTNLGSNSIASATGGSANIQITGTAPALVGGGGAAGSRNISILPWAIGGSTSADGGSTFITYTAENGIRPLDTTTEFASDFNGVSTNNVRLTSATALTGDVTANSLIVAGVGLSGANKVTVTSGAVLLVGGSSTISAGLDFGSAEGIVGYTRGNVVSGAVAGSGGLTVYGTRTDENLSFTNGSSTYSGNTFVFGNMMVSSGFLPSASRTGDIYVHGNLQLNVGGFTGTINGLFGNGTVSYGNSVVSTLSIGDNNASSTFTGTIAGNNNLNITKIGSGTITLTGANTYGRATSILGGTLDVTQLANGGIASGIGSSAATATNLVINGGSLRYTGAATSTDRLFQVGQTTNGGTATIDASGTGAVNFTATGSIVYGTAGTTGTSQTRTLVLTGANTGDNTLAALIGNNGAATNGNSAVSVSKTGAGTWVLAGANTYTGTTTVSQGVLALGASDRIADASNLVMAGGRFETRGFSETLGTLTLSATSVIDLGAGASLLAFADSSAATWSSSISLNFVNYTNGVDSIRFGTTSAGLTSTQLAQITINGAAALIDANGYLSSSAIPEPSAFAVISGLSVLVAFGLRRRRA